MDLEEVITDSRQGPLSNDYLKINKLGHIPSFVGADGYELTECIAIAIYGMFFSNFEPALGLAPFYDEKHFYYSYPCLKTIVETYSHSDTTLLYSIIDSLQAVEVFDD